MIYSARSAIMQQHIRGRELPERSTKKTDSCTKDFGDMSLELDAIEPDTLIEMVEDCIYEVMDTEILQQTLDAQKLEKEWIKTL